MSGLLARRTSRVASVLVPLAAVTLVVAACSSSSKNSSSTTSAGNAHSASAAGAAASVETHSGPMGTYLTDGSGKTLYMFASDSATKSSCSGACASFWPPFTTSGTPTAMSGVSGKLTTITRPDGTKQVVFAGHPLYYFKLDTSAGDTKGQGSNNFGAKWWLMAPSGQPITSSSGGSTS